MTNAMNRGVYMMKKIELLAPAGDFDSLVAAVQNGADAVYFGGNMFNARRGAVNFDGEEMKRAIRYAHLYNVKVYITFNILIKEHELDEALNFLYLLDELNVDGVIVQDIGLAKLIREEFPNLPIHASTQMTIHNIEGLRALEDMGISRAILAREVTLKEIENMVSKSSIELEVFIHGALCICYSGQCLMSSMLGGRSGNRGMCAQPCRLPYELIDSTGKVIQNKAHLLSPKDLCTYDFLYNIIDAGVTSLKIEGRMKRPEYVGIITRSYRQLIDSAIPSQDHRQELLQIFNRGGFTSGYYFGMDNQDIICAQKPNNWGVYVGEVLAYLGDGVQILLEEDLTIGDGIEFWIHEGQNSGQLVDNIYVDTRRVDRARAGQTITLKTKKYVRPGTKVYKTSSIELLEEIRPSFEQPYDTRKIPVKMKGHFIVDKKPYLKIIDEKGIEGSAIGEASVEKAITSPLSYSDIRDQLERLGGTPFSSVDTDIVMDDNIFMPKSAINRLRRQAVAELLAKRIASFESSRRKRRPSVKRDETFKGAKPSNNKSGQRPKLMLYTDHMNLEEDVIANVDGVCLYPNNWKSLSIEDTISQVERCKSYDKLTRLVLPRIVHEEDINLIRSLDPRIWTIFDGYQGGNIGTIYLLKDMGVDKIIGDFSLNITNSASLEVLEGLDIDSVVLSPELTIRELDGIIKKSNVDCEVLVHGHLPLMIMQHCPVGVSSKDCSLCKMDEGILLRDRKGLEFPLKKIEIARCYSQLLNSKLLFMAHQLNKIIALDVKYLGIYNIYNYEDIEMVTGLYRYVLNNTDECRPQYIEDTMQKIMSKGYTNGHFFRGVH